MATVSEIHDLFLGPMMALWKPVNPDPSVLSMVIGFYEEDFADADATRFPIAIKYLRSRHKSAWMPSIADCLTVLAMAHRPELMSLTIDQLHAKRQELLDYRAQLTVLAGGRPQ